MAYEEYDYYNEPAGDQKSLKESLREILNGIRSEKNLREAGASLKSALQLTPNVTESLGRGGGAQAIGTSGDLRDLSNMINSYLPKGVRNFTRAAEFLANPYATAIQQTAPTTEQTLDFVPRMSAPYEGYRQHETLGEFVAPSLGYFGGKAAKAYGNYVGPTAYKAVEDYLTKTGGILNAIEPSEVKKIQEVASAIDELGFHSPLENAILKIQQPKGTGDQFLKQLEKMPGVKTEELEVTGVKKYLQEHPTVTKEELLDYMGHGRVELQNKILTKQEEIANNEADYQIQGGDVHHDEDYIRSIADDLHYDMKNDPVIRDQERQALLEADPERYADYETNPYSQARLEEDIDGVLYEQAKTRSEEMYYESPMYHHYDEYGYDIYGNDEIGYSVRGPNGEHVDIGDQYDIADVGHELRMHHLDNDILDYTGNDEDFAQHERWSLPGKYTNYREVLTYLPENIAGEIRGGKRFNEISNKIRQQIATPEEQKEFSNLVDLGTRKEFESSHFEQPNILAHTRLNDRIINGKKTLMVEEIQSDWHQAGRKKGYDTPEVRQKIKNERQKLLDEKQHFAELAEPYTNIGQDAPPEIVDGWTRAANGIQELQQIENSMRSAVPNAPFKKNWHEMMMKQILNEAVKGNYDAVAFTTGRQQVERYTNELRQAVDEINYNKRDDNTISINGIKGNRETFAGVAKDGKFISGPREAIGKTIEEVLGKGIAKQVEEGELLKPGTIRGDNLTIGGEGMKGFYDKILPEFINKYGKKYGISTKKANLPGERLPSQEAVNDYLKSINMPRQEFDKLSIDERAKILDDASPKGEEVHYFDLSDMAKKDIKEKGQPLFSGIGLAAPALMPEDQDKTGR